MFDYFINTLGYVFMNLTFGKVKDDPTALLEAGIFTLVFSLYMWKVMPVIAIGFNGKVFVGEGNINPPSSNRELWAISHVAAVKFVHKEYFDFGSPGLKPVSIVSCATAARAKASIIRAFHSGRVTMKGIAAMPALAFNHFHLALRMFATKVDASLTTESTSSILDVAQRCLNGLSTRLAECLNHWRSVGTVQVFIKAFIAAILGVAKLQSGWVNPKRLTAYFTHNIYFCVFLPVLSYLSFVEASRTTEACFLVWPGLKLNTTDRTDSCGSFWFVASHRAKPGSIYSIGSYLERFTAAFANLYSRWFIASKRTVFPMLTWYRLKRFAATLTNLCNRHNKIPPTRDVRLDIFRRGRLAVGSGLFGAVHEASPIPM